MGAALAAVFFRRNAVAAKAAPTKKVRSGDGSTENSEQVRVKGILLAPLKQGSILKARDWPSNSANARRERIDANIGIATPADRTDPTISVVFGLDRAEIVFLTTAHSSADATANIAAKPT